MLGWRPVKDGVVCQHIAAKIMLPYLLHVLLSFSKFLMINSSIVFCTLQIGPYIWKSYREVYEEVLQVGSALQQLGVKPVRTET
jgi:hypothetical protein